MRDLPFEFLAEIAGGARRGGRLLFFWDGVVGLMFEGAAVCRVIFDQTPKDALRRAVTPALLHELEATYDPEGRYKKPYIYPSRRMALAPILALLGPMCCEALVDEALLARLDEEDFAEAYRFAAAMDEGFFKREDRGANRQRLIGAPDPEQDDPRYNALDPAELPPYPWSPEASRHAARRALDWRLPLQLDLGDLSQQSLTEGAVYFVIAKDDLAQREFSRVRAYYQQT